MNVQRTPSRSSAAAPAEGQSVQSTQAATEPEAVKAGPVPAPAGSSAPADAFTQASGPSAAPSSDWPLKPPRRRARAEGSVLIGAAPAAQVDAAAPAPAGAGSVPVPDAHGVAGNAALRYLDLNKEITKGYVQFANVFQGIVDPAFQAGGTSSIKPVWFGFAPYASRLVGQSQLAAQSALAAVQHYQSTDLKGVLERAGLPDRLAGAAALALNAVLPVGEARMAGAFVVGLLTAGQNPGSLKAGALAALLDPRTLAITAHRMLELVRSAPGADLMEKFGAVAGTIRNTMEDGNRRIYGDIGGAAQDYLNFRNAHGGRVTPDQIVEGFSLSQPPDAKQAREVYDFAISHLNDVPQPTDFDRLFPAPRYDAKNVLVAAFAMYEQAGQTPDAGEKNKLISFANNLLAFREQRDAVQRAFTPGRVLPGEVDRDKLFQALTPTVELDLPSGGWTFNTYANRHLPARDRNPFTPRVTEYNWSRFEDRWVPILDAFEAGYRAPSRLWPMPDPDPNVSR
jgi:hypothetical protein